MNENKYVIQINGDSFTSLLAGLYVMYNETRVEAIPLSLWFELSEKLYPYVKVWDYNKISLEQWIKDMLLILPKPMIPEIELNHMKNNNEIYFERFCGNVVLVVTAPVFTVENGAVVR